MVRRTWNQWWFWRRGHTVNYSYTGIRTYRTEKFSPQKQLTVCFVQSGIQIYRIQNLSPNQSGIRAIDCNAATYKWKNSGENGIRFVNNKKRNISIITFDVGHRLEFVDDVRGMDFQMRKHRRPSRGCWHRDGDWAASDNWTVWPRWWPTPLRTATASPSTPRRPTTAVEPSIRASDLGANACICTVGSIIEYTWKIMLSFLINFSISAWENVTGYHDWNFNTGNKGYLKPDFDLSRSETKWSSQVVSLLSRYVPLSFESLLQFVNLMEKLFVKVFADFL